MVFHCYYAMLRQSARRLSAAYDEASESFGTNIAQFLLRTVASKAPISPSELGSIIGLDRSTIGRDARVLERMNMIRTGRGDDDKREAVVTLTEQGRDLIQAVIPAWEQCQPDVEGRLADEGIAALGLVASAA